MAHPKRRTSSAKRNKRRSHDKLTPKAVTLCATTGDLHLRHKAYVVDGDLYLHGKVAIRNYAPVAAPAATSDNDEE